MMTLSRLGMCVTAKGKVIESYEALSFLAVEYLKFIYSFSGQTPEKIRESLFQLCSTLAKEEVDYVAGHKASMTAKKLGKGLNWDIHPAFGGKDTGIGEMLTAYGLRPSSDFTYMENEVRGITLSAVVAIDILASANRFHQGNVATLGCFLLPAQEGFKNHLAAIAGRPLHSIQEQEREHLVTLRAAGIDIFNPKTEVALTVAMFIWEALFLRANKRVSHCTCDGCLKEAENLLSADKMACDMITAVSIEERVNSLHWWLEPFLTKPVNSVALCLASQAVNFLTNTGFSSLVAAFSNSREVGKTPSSDGPPDDDEGAPY